MKTLSEQILNTVNEIHGEFDADREKANNDRTEIKDLLGKIVNRLDNIEDGMVPAGKKVSQALEPLVEVMEKIDKNPKKRNFLNWFRKKVTSNGNK